MNNSQNIETWADSHETAIEIANVIFEMADSNDDAERIWQNPTDSEILEIWKKATHGELLNASDLFWGVDSLDEIMENVK